MSRKCKMCDKKALNSNLVSHSHRKTKTLQQPNLVNAKLLINGIKTKIRICTSCLKTHIKKIA